MSDHEKVASPSAANLIALSMALFIYWLLLTGKVAGAAALAAGYYVVGCGLIQLIGSIFEFIRGETLVANLILTFSILFLALSGMNLIVEYYKLPMDPRLSGWITTFLAVVLIVITPAFFKGIYYLTADLIVIDALLVLFGLAQLGVLPLVAILVAGWLCFIGSIISLIIVVATFINTAYEREIIPLPKPKGSSQTPSLAYDSSLES